MSEQPKDPLTPGARKIFDQTRSKPEEPLSKSRMVEPDPDNQQQQASAFIDAIEAGIQPDDNAPKKLNERQRQILEALSQSRSQPFDIEVLRQAYRWAVDPFWSDVVGLASENLIVAVGEELKNPGDGRVIGKVSITPESRSYI